MTGSITSGSKTVTTTTAQFASTDGGASVSGTGIAGGSTISTFDTSMQVELSANANATATESLSITWDTTNIWYGHSASGTWTWSQVTNPSGGNNDLSGVSCPRTTTCYFVGDSYIVWGDFSSSTTSPTWHSVTPTTHAPWVAISCVGSSQSSDACYAVANGPYNSGTNTESAILATTTGFSSMAQDYAGTNIASPLTSVSCVTGPVCAIGGGGGDLFYGPPSSGTHWPDKNISQLDIGGVSCTGGTTCYASIIDNSGVNDVYTTTNFSASGGGTWTGHGSSGSPLPNHASYYLGNVSCVSGVSDTCFIVGNGTGIMTSSDSGSTWTNLSDGVSSGILQGISCTSTVCQAVGGSSGLAAITHN